VTWRIENAKSGRSSCDHCDERILKGDPRFGRTGRNSVWYHLGCASKGNPSAFKPFAAEAAKLLKAAPKPKAATLGVPLRNPELEARLLANPGDLATRAVFADWLQGIGDPWGELIAYVDAGKKKEAKRVMTAHRDRFTGGLGSHLFRWKNGFVDHVSAGTGKPEKTMTLVERIFALPTTILTRHLLFPVAPDAAIAARLSACAPRSLRILFCWMSNGVSDLDLPALERLSLFSPAKDRHWPRGMAECDANGLRGLFDAKKLPKLRQLELLDPIPASIIEKLIESKLLRQLTRLQMTQSCFDAAGARLLLAHVPAFQHLKQFTASLPGNHQATFDERFAPQQAAWADEHDLESVE
jgi:uncharacterized protein (TIGR02996 family)